jgi:hypothetical protein
MQPWDDAHSRLWHYSHSGVNISSELELPEWSQCEQVSGWSEPDVLIRVEPPEHSEPATTQQPFIAGSEYGLRVPRVAQFHVLNGREIRVRPLATTEPSKVRLWLLGTIWGILCYQRGWFIVHASGVRINGEAVIFCGQAGRGKSTLAAQLDNCGYPLISDDLCRLDFSAQGQPVVYPAPPRLKLWSDALGELGWGTREMAPDQSRQGKFHLSLAGLGPASGLTKPLPVGAAYLLAWGEFNVRQLQGVAAFQDFLAGATWRMRLLASMDQSGPHLRRCLKFLRHVPLGELTRPRDFSESAQTLDFIVGRGSRTAV